MALKKTRSFMIVSILIAYYNVCLSADNLYQKQANAVCHALTTSFTYYQQKKTSLASKWAEKAYWDIYDSILEISYRPYTSPAHIFSVENDFHQFETLATKSFTNANQQTLAALNKKICQEVHEQATLLTTHHS